MATKTSTQAQGDTGAVNFTFQHRVFSAPGCTFRKSADGSDVVMTVELGDVKAALPLDSICASFQIAPDSPDHAMLKRVRQALKFVREIHPGDSIPTEVIDGRASWMVEERFMAAAKARVAMQLVAWLRGQHTGDISHEELLAKAESPEIRNAVQEAFSAIAEKLGYGASGKQEVVSLIDRIARELSYIEALRDRFMRIKRMTGMMKGLQSAYHRERAILEVITRCNVLMMKPTRQLLDVFTSLDANTGEILQTLRNFETQIGYIRKTRDDLREAYLLWEELLAKWDDYDGTPGPQTEPLIRETYRFAARQFSVASTWASSAA